MRLPVHLGKKGPFMSFFDGVRTELALRALLSDEHERLITTLETEYYNQSTTNARKQDIYSQMQAMTLGVQLCPSSSPAMLKALTAMLERSSSPSPTTEKTTEK